MFNKPTLFPKSTSDATSPVQTPAPRGGRLVPSGSGLVSGSSSTSEPVVSVREAAAANSANAAREPVAGEQVGESRLVVGPNVKLRGAEILDCDTLIVEGRVEAKMDSRVIRIAENGFFSGTVGIDVAEVNGRFEGELTARSQLIIHSTGRVSGTIRYGKIFIEEGGEISGDIKSIDPSAPVRTSSAPATVNSSSISSSESTASAF